MRKVAWFWLSWTLACGGPAPAPPPPSAFQPGPPPQASDWELVPGDLLRQPREIEEMAWVLDLVSAEGMAPGAAVEGFSVPEVGERRSFVWAVGERSRLRFPLERVDSVDLEMRARAFSFPGAPEQRVSVSVNGVAAGVVVLGSATRSHRVALPVGALRAGWNELVLSYAWHRAPREVLPGNEDLRSLAVAYEGLRLVRAGTAVEHGVAEFAGGAAAPALAQRGPGAVSWLLIVPDGAFLDLAWVTPAAGEGPVTLRVTLEHDDRIETLLDESLVCDGLPGERQLDLAAWAGRAARLRLAIDGLPADARWMWTRARLASEAWTGPAPARARAGTNVVIVILDAAQRARFGIHGGTQAATPNTDALAGEALVFDRAYASAPYTLASTASLFTSLPPAWHGVVEKNHRLGEDVPLLAQILLDAGYATGAFSANLFVTRSFGMARGFETFREMLRDVPGRPIVPARELSDAAFSWLRERAEEGRSGQRPFFLYLHYIQPHEPYNVAPPEFYRDLASDYEGPIDGSVANMYDIFAGRLRPDGPDLLRLQRLYEGNLRYVDAEVGRLVDEMRALDLLERTLLIVTSDHGEALGERGLFGHNSSVDDTMTAIPLIARFPAPFPGRPQGRSDALVSTIDVAPLVLESVGVPVPAAFAGRNPLRTPAVPRVISARTPGERPDVALWFGDQKCILGGGSGRASVGPAREVDSVRPAVVPAVSFDLCRQARRALEAGRGSSVARARGALSEQERQALEALGYLRE